MSEEPQFFRIRFIELQAPQQWVRACDLSQAPWLYVSTGSRPKAKVFVSPSERELQLLRGVLGPIELEPATFAEWVEEGAEKTAIAETPKSESAQ